jgi:penicillin G amidase
MRWVGRIVLIVVIVIAAVLLWLRTTGPGSDATLRVAGLSAPVTIDRDRYGIATITAANMRDAVFALGFLHAEERLFQMELTRRFGAGRLSELFGPAALPTDKYMRVLGLYRAAEAEYRVLSPDARAELDAYVAGVNAWLRQRSVALPPEYYLIRARPEPWKPADSLVWGKLMALQLAGNFRDELLRARILRRVGPDRLSVLFPAYPKGMPSAAGEDNAWLKGLDLDGIYAALPNFVGPIYESNNWVLDGKHTVSGKPMLANDPHLALNAPGTWYLARIKTPEADVAGVTAPGNPYIVLGHNAQIAWGFTTTTGDVEDLFIEKVDSKNPGNYLTPTGSEPFVTREETIAVRGGPSVKLAIRATRHGPVISDLGGKYAATADSGTVLALQTTWLTPDDRSPEALRGINFAENWTEFRDAMRLFVAPEQNMVFADTAGNIGFIAPARIPIRGKGDGYMPVPGWSGDYDWKGFIPFDDLPQGYNPPSGRFVTANAKIVPDSYKYFISRDWDIPNRTERINELLDVKDKKFGPADFAAIQADTMSLMALDLVPLMTAIQPSDERDRRAVERLKSWNFHMDRDLVEPLIFAAWLRELDRALFAKKLGEVFPDYWSPRPNVVRGVLTEHRDWCLPDGGKPGDCAAVLTASLHSALDQLAARHGDDIARWNWGRAHVAPFVNQFWSNVPVFRELFRLDIPTDGGSDTVNRGEMEYPDDAAPFADLHGPGLRMIVDMAAPATARFLIAPGQSANPLSAHYGDLVQRWRDFAWLTFGTATPAMVTRLLPDAMPNRGN